MGVMGFLKSIGNDYVAKQVKRMNMPFIENKDLSRKKIIFQGRVQHVGFRLEVQLLAEKLGLTGKAVNLNNGAVEVELQGAKAKIDYVIHTMMNLKRIKIDNYSVEDIPIVNREKSFVKH